MAKPRPKRISDLLAERNGLREELECKMEAYEELRAERDGLRDKLTKAVELLNAEREHRRAFEGGVQMFARATMTTPEAVLEALAGVFALGKFMKGPPGRYDEVEV